MSVSLLSLVRPPLNLYLCLSTFLKLCLSPFISTPFSILFSQLVVFFSVTFWISSHTHILRFLPFSSFSSFFLSLCYSHLFLQPFVLFCVPLFFLFNLCLSLLLSQLYLPFSVFLSLFRSSCHFHLPSTPFAVSLPFSLSLSLLLLLLSHMHPPFSIFLLLSSFLPSSLHPFLHFILYLLSSVFLSVFPFHMFILFLPWSTFSSLSGLHLIFPSHSLSSFMPTLQSQSSSSMY